MPRRTHVREHTRRVGTVGPHHERWVKVREHERSIADPRERFVKPLPILEDEKIRNSASSLVNDGETVDLLEEIISTELAGQTMEDVDRAIDDLSDRGVFTELIADRLGFRPRTSKDDVYLDEVTSLAVTAAAHRIAPKKYADVARMLPPSRHVFDKKGVRHDVDILAAVIADKAIVRNTRGASDEQMFKRILRDEGIVLSKPDETRVYRRYEIELNDQ